MCGLGEQGLALCWSSSSQQVISCLTFISTNAQMVTVLSNDNLNSAGQHNSSHHISHIISRHLDSQDFASNHTRVIRLHTMTNLVVTCQSFSDHDITKHISSTHGKASHTIFEHTTTCQMTSSNIIGFLFFLRVGEGRVGLCYLLLLFFVVRGVFFLRGRWERGGGFRKYCCSRVCACSQEEQVNETSPARYMSDTRYTTRGLSQGIVQTCPVPRFVFVLSTQVPGQDLRS